MAQLTYLARKGEDANFAALAADSLTLAGVAVDTAVLLASGQVVDLNGEADALILDAAQAVRLDGSTAGTLKVKISGAYDFTFTANTFTALAGSTIKTDTIAETTGAAGVTVDGVLLKDTACYGRTPVTAVTADGAISIPAYNTIFLVTKAGVAAMTLADPTSGTHDGVELTFIATTANAHTLDNSAGSGFNAGGAGADVGTFGGAVGDLIKVVAYQGKWYVTANTNVTLG